MKKMLRISLMAAAMFMTVTTVAKAQGGGGRGRGRDPMTIVKDSLGVTDAKVLAKVDSIVKAAQQESAPLMEAMRGGDADARTKMGAVTAKRNAAIKALLTPEQQTKFDALMPAGGRRGGGF